MKQPAKFKKYIKISMAFFIVLFAATIIYLAYSIISFGDEWANTPYNPRIQAEKDIKNAGDITDRNGVTLAWTEDDVRNYHTKKDIRRALSHVIGDTTGMTVGAQSIFQNYLYGIDNDVTDRINAAISGTEKKGGDLSLTVDSKLSEYIYDHMGAKTGSVVVMNYKTGEILSSVSIPTFDPITVAEETPQDTSLIDRAVMGRYPPGSLMKMVTASAAVEEGIDFSYTCTGEEIVDGQKITCVSKHGELDLKQAFAKSCNCYFAKLSVALGEQALQEQAEKFAFNTEFSFSDVVLYKSNFETGSNEGDLAWAGIGQHKDLITPLHAAMIAGTIANDGVMMEPKLLLSCKTGNYLTEIMSETPYRTVLSESTANVLKEYMKEAVKTGTGTSAAVKGAEIGLKTGTAEYFSEEENKVKNHSWAAGFIDDDAHPYCMAAIFEGAGFGSKYAAPLIGKVFSYLLSEGI